MSCRVCGGQDAKPVTVVDTRNDKDVAAAEVCDRCMDRLYAEFSDRREEFDALRNGGLSSFAANKFMIEKYQLRCSRCGQRGIYPCCKEPA